MATLFADIKTPYINDLTLKRVMSQKVKENIFQGIFTRPGEAVTEKFSEDTDAAEIQVIRVKPDSVLARELGSANNGAWFNSASAHTPTTEAYGIKIIQTVDNVIDIPTNAQDMINVDLADAELQNLAGKVNKNVNACTIAAQLAKYFNTYDNAATQNWVSLAATPDYLAAITEANAKLDDGNAEQGIDAYPSDSRAIFIRSDAKAALLKSGQVIVGGSNYAQDILRRGGLDADTDPDVAATGYLGTIEGVKVYMCSAQVWALAELYAGVPTGTFAQVKMLVVSSIGTGRALAFNSAIKMIDAPNGQGRRIQPKYRFGAECWDAMSVVPVVVNGAVAPRATSSAAALTVTAPGSRSKVATPTGTDDGSHKFKLACTTANATIVYTTDGSIPSFTNGTTYSSQVTLTGAATVKAIAYLNGNITSDVFTLTVA